MLAWRRVRAEHVFHERRIRSYDIASEREI
jgi:hypothetical protein